MHIVRNALIIGIISVLFAGCAASYKLINPETLNYHTDFYKDSISFSYKYDVLLGKANKKYDAREDKKGVRVVAVKIINNTDQVINFGTNIKLYSGNNEILPLEPHVTYSALKQGVPAFLAYLLLTPVNLYITNSNSTEVIPIGLALGPGLTIGNMAVSGTANSKFKNELLEYNLLVKGITPGETVYGLIGINDMEHKPLSLKVELCLYYKPSVCYTLLN